MKFKQKNLKWKNIWCFGFRKIEGIRISEFERKFRINPLFYFRFEIDRLVKKGYLDSIEYQDGKQSIYYLIEQCNNIAIPFELTEEDKESDKEFLYNIGVVG